MHSAFDIADHNPIMNLPKQYIADQRMEDEPRKMVKKVRIII